MRALDKDLWVAEQPLRFGLLQLGTRMTVIRLSDASLLLHSPIALTESLRMEIEELGSVRYVIAPNRFHHLFASDWTVRYPRSRLYVAPGLHDKRPDLTITGVLPQEDPHASAVRPGVQHRSRSAVVDATHISTLGSLQRLRPHAV